MKINKFYLFSFFYHLAYSALAAIAIIAFTNNGLSLKVITFAQSVAWASSLVLEVPSGMLADYFGRKRTIILTCVFEFLSIVVYFFSKNFLFLLIGQLLFAISECCLSGTFDAWLFSSANPDKSEPRKKITRNGTVCLIANLIGGTLGGLLTNIWNGFLWIFSGTMILICFFICLTMKDIVTEKKILSFSDGLKKVTSPLKSISSIFKSKPALILLPEMWFISFFLAGPNNLWQPFFLTSLQKTASFISFMWIFIQLIQILVNFIISKFKIITDNFIITSIITLFFISFTIILLSLFHGNYICIPIFLLFIFFYSLQGPILGTFTAEIFKEEDRATCFSILSLIGSVISAIGLSLGGYLSDIYGIPFVYKFAGIALIFVLILHIIFSLLMSIKSKYKN